MNLLQLVSAVGHENIKVQRIDSNLNGAKELKDGSTELRLVTDSLSTTDVMNLTKGIAPKMHGLVIWIPRDLIPTF